MKRYRYGRLAFAASSLLLFASAAQAELSSAKHPREVLLEARKLIAASEFSNAVQNLSNLIPSTTKALYIAKARWYKGQALCGLGDYPAALEEFRSAVAANALCESQMFELRLDLMRTEAKTGNSLRARELCAEIQNLYFCEHSPMFTDPKHFLSPDKARLLFARALSGSGMKDESLQYALAAAGPSNREQRLAALFAARALDGEGKFANAITLLAAASAPSTNDVGAETSKIYRELARINLRSGRNEMALQWIEAGNRRLTNTALLAGYRYDAARLLRDYSVPSWKPIMEDIALSDAKSTRVGALEYLRACAGDTNDWRNAERFSRRLISLPERKPAQFVEDYLCLARTLHAQKKDTSAVVASLSAYLPKARPEDDDLLMRIGKTMESLGRDDVAELAYRKVNSFDLNNRSARLAHRRLADVLRRTQRGNEALGEYWNFIDRSHQAGDRRQAIEGLVALSASANTVAGGKFNNLDVIIDGDAARIEDDKTLCDLALFLKNRDRHDLAVKCVENACRIAGLHASRATATARAESEQRIVRRMVELGLYTQAVARAQSVPGEVLNHASVSLETRLDLSYYRARAMYRAGDKEDALKVFDDILAATSSDDRLRAAYAAAIGTDLYLDNPARALEIFRIAAVNGGGPHAALANLYLAADDIEHKRLADAEKRIRAVTTISSPTAEVEWQRRIYWSALFVRGVLAQQRGDSKGAMLMDEAKQSALVWDIFLQIANSRMGI